MAGSRLERIGTIFSRATGLLQSKAMALEDRPIWYDVYKNFPPALPPRFDRAAPQEPLKNIFYSEDIIRAKFHQRMGRRLPIIDLSDNKTPSVTQRLIELCKKIQDEKKMSLDDAFESAFGMLKAEGVITEVTSRRYPQQVSKDEVSKDISLAGVFKRASQEKTDIPLQVNVKDILKDDNK